MIKNCRLQQFLGIISLLGTPLSAHEAGLVGHWKVSGDSQDASGLEQTGANHSVDLSESSFNGSNAYIEIRDSAALDFGTGDFSIVADIYTEKGLADVPGDIVSKYDPVRRQGFTLGLANNTAGYNAPSDVRQLFFGTDNGTAGDWADCGRPNPKTHISDALTVFDGDLYAGTADGPDESDWAHVYRFKGGQEWEDCGRLGSGKTRGVYAMVVHDGVLYAATSASHGSQPATMDYGRVYRYRSGQQWDDIGQPGENYRLNSLASFQGKLYVAGFNIGPNPGHCYVYDGGKCWSECGKFNGWPHALAVHDKRLYAAYPQGEVYAYDGATWTNLGNPGGTFAECNQVHSLGVFQGELYAGSWPKGKVAVLRDGKWVDLGRLGDATEVIGLTVYNGSLFAGTIPRAELFRLDCNARWTSVRRLFDPPGFEPVAVGCQGRSGLVTCL
jgi:hypothetical protein